MSSVLLMLIGFETETPDSAFFALTALLRAQ